MLKSNGPNPRLWARIVYYQQEKNNEDSCRPKWKRVEKMVETKV